MTIFGRQLRYRLARRAGLASALAAISALAASPSSADTGGPQVGVSSIAVHYVSSSPVLTFNLSSGQTVSQNLGQLDPQASGIHDPQIEEVDFDYSDCAQGVGTCTINYSVQWSSDLAEFQGSFTATISGSPPSDSATIGDVTVQLTIGVANSPATLTYYYLDGSTSTAVENDTGFSSGDCTQQDVNTDLKSALTAPNGWNLTAGVPIPKSSRLEIYFGGACQYETLTLGGLPPGLDAKLVTHGQSGSYYLIDGTPAKWGHFAVSLSLTDSLDDLSATGTTAERVAVGGGLAGDGPIPGDGLASADYRPIIPARGWAGPNPPGNCRGSSFPISGRFTDGPTIVALDQCAANQEGISPMLLPSNYTSLSELERGFVLFNLERIRRGEAPLVGISKAMDRYALAGSKAHADPGGGASIWDGGDFIANGMIGWIYDDGPGSLNLDCTPTDRSGCWGHRDNILEAPDDADLVVGEAELHGANATAVFTGEDAANRSLVFSWRQELPHIHFPRNFILRPISIKSVRTVNQSAAAVVATNLDTVTGVVLAGRHVQRELVCTSQTRCELDLAGLKAGRYTLAFDNHAGKSNSVVITVP